MMPRRTNVTAMAASTGLRTLVMARSIAGGLLLLVLSIHDLLRPNTPLRQPRAPPGWSRSVSR